MCDSYVNAVGSVVETRNLSRTSTAISLKDEFAEFFKLNCKPEEENVS